MKTRAGMMSSKMRLAAGAAVLLMAPVLARAADDVSVSGQWKIHSSIMGRESDQNCTFGQKGQELTGNCGNDPNAGAITGTLDGKNVKWQSKAEYQGMALTIDYKGTVESDKITGTVTINPGGMGGEFTAVRPGASSSSAASATAQPQPAAPTPVARLTPRTAKGKFFETNVTNDLAIASGEPEIAVDPQDPRHLVVIEFGLGSAEVPAYSTHPIVAPPAGKSAAGLMHGGRLMESTDGGNTWHHLATPVYDKERAPQGGGGGDPMVAIGPDGTIYAAVEPFPSGRGQLGNMSAYSFKIAVSTDKGKTFQSFDVGTPVDRPFMKVDLSTGVVYTASSGFLDTQKGTHNQPGASAIDDRWLVAWKPHLTSHSEPRRIGGPDFSPGMGNTLAAANGVVATEFILPGLSLGAGTVVPSSSASTIPASLKGLVNDGTESCTMQAPCLFFQTSSDEGKTWARHHVPVPGGFSGMFAYVAADPGRRGRYAIGLQNKGATGLQVVLTDDSGATWSKPISLPQVAQGAAADAPAGGSIMDMISRGTIIKPWMDYGPTGVLGFMWKQKRDDVKGPAAPKSMGPGNTWGPGFDVYAAISCDGGTTWLPPVRVSAEPSPAGPNSQDDLSYIALDAQNAHLIWGDRRSITDVTNAPNGIGGVQAYYGRVPFSEVSNGRQCGRK